MLNYKRAEQSDRMIQCLSRYKLSENRRVAVECEETSCGCISCLSQAFIVIIIVVSLKLYSGT